MIEADDLLNLTGIFFWKRKSTKQELRSSLILGVKMEARVGIEPAYTELQSAA